jgi:hypothetical protein
MEEKKLMQVLIVIGIVSLCVITYSSIMMDKSLGKLYANILPEMLCAKDASDEYVLGKANTASTCSTILDLYEDIESTGMCNGFDGDKKTSCQELVKIVRAKKGECYSGLFAGFDGGRPYGQEVEAHCAVLLSD